MANTNPAHIVTGKVRLTYTSLFTPRSSQPGQEAKYYVTILVPKSDAATIQRINAAIAAATEAGIAKKWGGVKPPVVSVCVHDGDGARPSGDSFGNECKGHLVFTASSTQKPEVVDLNLNPILNPNDVYSGCYARVGVTFFAYNSAGKKGIGCGLETVQKLEDGEALGGRASAADDFGDPAPYTPSVAPVPQYAQPAPVYPQAAYPMQSGPVVDPITGQLMAAPVAGAVMGL